MTARREWYPPATQGWLLCGATARPVHSEDIVQLAIEGGYEPEEVDVIAAIARSQNLDPSPFIDVRFEEEDSTCTVEVIVPPEDTEAVEVYNRYNS